MTDGPDQADLGEFAAATTTENVTKTLTVPLETSDRKSELLERAVEEFAEMASFWADVLPSYPEHEWTPNHTEMYRHITDEFDDDTRTVKSTIAREAQQKVTSAFTSWSSNGKPGARPQFEEVDYVRLSHQDLTLAENDRGYGLKVRAIPNEPEWFHCGGGAYQTELLERVCDEADSASLGAAEIVVEDDGGVTAKLNISFDVEVYEPDDVATTVGVDLGERVLYAVAVTDSDGTVETVEVESGREFRHYREQLEARRERLSEAGDLKGVRETRGDRERYTEQVTHTASRRIVDLAADHAPCAIHLEDLTGYRESATDAIHDWPHAMLQEQIMYKATEAGIPVRVVDPAGTSYTCRQCGAENPAFREGDEFDCWECGYEVHADVNAAINIAKTTS